MYRYDVYITIVIKGEIYQDLLIFKSFKAIDEDDIRYDAINRYYKKLNKCDSYKITIVRNFKEI